MKTKKNMKPRKHRKALQVIDLTEAEEKQPQEPRKKEDYYIPGENKWFSDEDINVLVQSQIKEKDLPLAYCYAYNPKKATWKNCIKPCLKKWLSKKERKRYAGLVLNTSGGAGLHWVSIVLDSVLSTIDYFDSTHKDPLEDEEENIAPLVLDRIKDLQKMLKGWELRAVTTKKEFQVEDGNQCGMYAVWHLVTRASGVTLEEFQRKRMPPKKIKDLRVQWFKYIDLT